MKFTPKPPRPKANWTQVPGAWQLKPKPRRPIRKRTPKRASEDRRYNREVAIWIVGKACERCGKPATQCNHYRGRIKGLLLDRRHWRPVCDLCHHWMHLNVKAAQEAGFLAGPGEWNVVPKGEA